MYRTEPMAKPVHVPLQRNCTVLHSVSHLHSTPANVDTAPHGLRACPSLAVRIIRYSCH